MISVTVFQPQTQIQDTTTGDCYVLKFLRRRVDGKYSMREVAIFKFPRHNKINLASADLVTTVCHATVCHATVCHATVCHSTQYVKNQC